MAKTNVPNQPSNNGDAKKREQAARSKKQKGYQESLSYERAFLKKKSELNNSAEMQQRQKAIEDAQKRADEEMRIARLTIRNKADLEKELRNIQARFAADTADMQRELISEREKNEYAAHLFASECARKAAQAQNLRQRAQTAAALADAQKVQTARLRHTKELEIADLQAQKKSAETAEERKEIDAKIRKLRREIASAEREEARSQEAAVDLAKRVADADFARLSAKDKLKQKQKELTALQAEADAAIDDIELQIAAKKMDLEDAEKSGKTRVADSIRKEIDSLQATLDSTTERYTTSISSLTDSIEGAGGYREQAKQETGTRVAPLVPAQREQTPPTDTEGEESEVPENVSSTDVAAQIGLVLSGLQTFETAFANYVDAVESMVTPEATEESVDGVVPLDTTGAENALKDSSTALINQLRALVDQSVNGDIELQSQLNAKIDELNQGLSSQLGNLSGLPESLSEGYSASVSDLVNEITGAVRSHVESQGTAEDNTTSIIVPPPVVNTEVPETLTLEDASVMGQLVLIQQTLSTFVNAFDSYINTVDGRFNSSDRALQSAMAMRTPVTPTSPVSDSAYEQLAALRTILSTNTNVEDDQRDRLNAELDRLQRSLDSGMEVDLTSVSESISRLGNEMSLEDLAKDLSDLQNSLLEDLLDSKDLNKLSDEKLHAAATGRVNKESEDKLGARLDARIANLAQIEKNKKFFAKGPDGAAARKDAVLEAAFEKMQDALDGLADLSKTIDSNINEYFRYQAEIDAKLQGTDLDYSDMLKTLTNNLGMSMLVSQKDYIAKFKELVDAGIAHNMETRAFLATVSDKVVNTFNAFDANLLRLVRLQQQDTTAARLGLESSLNKMFNSYFSDSSYLSDGPHDSISAAILEASSMLSNDMSVEFEYMVHKWLGSLYSLGMSSDTLESIAQGLNYLGTGNVAALNSNESLQTLLAMSAARGGESYAEILVNGLDADTTNNLLQGMITYLMEIASNTDNNQVTKSAYSDLFGMHMSDLRAVVNMTQNDITSLSNLTTSYTQAVNETQNQLASIIDRTHMSQMVETLFENAVLGASLDIGKNPVSYGLWKTLNIIEGLTGGIALPFVNVFGSGFDLNTTVTQLAKGAMAGVAMMGNLIGALGSGGVNSGMDVNEWNNTEMTSRGTGTSFLTSGTKSGFSSSARLDYAGSGSSGDIKKTEMSDATDTAKEDSEVTNKYSQEEQSVPEKIYEQTQLIYGALAEDDNTLLKQSVATYTLLQEKLESLSMLSQINSLLGPSRIFFTAGIDDGSISVSSVRTSQGLGSFGPTVNVSDYETQLESLQKVSSVFQNVVKNNQDLTGVSVDIWSLIDASSRLTANEMRNELKTQYSSRNDGFYNFNKYDQSTDVNTELVNKLATQIQTASISEQELKQFAQIQQLNKIVFPEYVRATIDDLAPGVKKYTEELLKRAIEMSIYGTDIESKYDDPDVDFPIVKKLVELLTDPATIVNVRASSM